LLLAEALCRFLRDLDARCLRVFDTFLVERRGDFARLTDLEERFRDTDALPRVGTFFRETAFGAFFEERMAEVAFLALDFRR
jgi:hypothetical protein